MFDCPVANFHVVAKVKPAGDVIERSFPEGMTVAQILHGLMVPAEHWQFVYVQIEDQPIFPGVWGRVRPKSGARVFVKVTPGISGAVALIGALASAAGTAAAGTGITIAGIGLSAATVGAVAGAVASVVATLVLTSIFSPSQPTRSRLESESQVFSITSARNRIIPFGAVPEVLGQHRFVPPYGAVPYTEIIGNDQYLRFIVLWGYGPVDVSDVKIGNTPIEDFDGVVQQHDFNGSGAAPGLYPNDVSQEDLNIVLDTTYVSRTTAIDVDEFSVDVTFPNGLYYIDPRGNRLHTAVRLMGRYRRVGTGPYTTFMNELVQRRQTTVVRFAKRVTGLTPGQYEVELLRADTEPTDGSRQERAVWTALRGFSNQANPVKFTGIANSAYRIKATDQLNGVIDQLNAVVGVLVPTWNGSSWSGLSVSRNPAACFRRVLTSAANKKARTSAQIDNDGLGEWYEYCEARGLHYDRVLDDQASVRDRLQDIAAAGFASPRLVDGKWGVVIDKPKTAISQHFTPRNSRNFRGQIVSAEIPHAYRIRFPNRDRGYIEDERIVYDDGYSAANATDFQVLDAPGKTDASDVYRWGRHILAAARLRPEIFTFDVDIEHLVAERGDLVKFTHDVAKIGLAFGRVKAVSGNDLTLDEPVNIEAGKSYTIRIRHSDGVTNSQAISTGAGTHTTITVTDGTGVAAGDLFMFGETGQETETLIIRSVQPIDDLGATLECVPYREAIYNSANTIPEYQSVISIPSSASMIGPPTPRITDVVSDEAALTVTSEGAIVPGILVYVQAGTGASPSDASVTATAFYQARFRENIDDAKYVYMPMVPVDAGRIALDPVISGEAYNVEVRAVGPFGEVSKWATVSNHVVAGTQAPPPSVATFGINVTGDQAYLEWTYPDIPLDCTGFEIRYSPDQSVTEWLAMTRISESVPRTARSFAVPARSGSYAIKPFDINGTRAVNAVFVNSSLEDPRNLNAVVAITEAPTFTGTKTNVAVIDSNLVLDVSSTMDTWTALSDVDSLSQGVGAETPTGEYEFGETDLGAVYTLRITADMIVGADDVYNTMDRWGLLADLVSMSGGVSGDEFTIQLLVSHSLTDAPTGQVWTDYRPFVVGDYTARHFRFKLVMTTTVESVIPFASRLNVTLDAPDRFVTGQNIASGTGGIAVTFSPAFHTLQSVNVAAQDLGTGDYMAVTAKSRTGFTVEFFDAAATSVDRTFDYQALGFGHERGT